LASSSNAKSLKAAAARGIAGAAAGQCLPTAMIERAAALTFDSSPLPTPSGHLQHRRRGVGYAP